MSNFAGKIKAPVGVEPTMADLQSASDQRKDTKPIRLQQYRQQSESTPTNEALINELVANAKKSGLIYKQDIEKLLRSIPLDDTGSIGIVSSILGDLKEAERGIERI